jgi:beta-xylosidase
VLALLDAVAVHGFPLDWNHWKLDEWPAKLAEIQAATSLPVWVTEVGVSTFGAEEVQEFGLQRTAQLLKGACRACIGTAFTICRAPGRRRPGIARRKAPLLPALLHGLLREDGTPKAACEHFAEHAPRWASANGSTLRITGSMKRSLVARLGVKHLRTGLSWADSFRRKCRCVV